MITKEFEYKTEDQKKLEKKLHFKNYRKIYRAIPANKKKHNDYNKKWREENEVYRKNYYKTFEKQNEEMTEKRRKRYNKRRKMDPLFRLIINMRTQLNVILKEKNINKKNKTLDILGCTPQELKIHLEKKFKPGMNWANHGVYGWHVDHIVPLNLAKTIDDVEYLMNYKNLQPLWATENILKSDKII